MSCILFNRRKYMARRRPIGAPVDMAETTITLSGTSFPYTGNPITPSVTVVFEGATLTVNTDYFVSYSDNTNVGAGTVTITGTGNYTGTVVKTFQITSASSGSWDFDLSKTAKVKEFTASNVSSRFNSFCPPPNDDSVDCTAITGTGYYYNHLTMSDFDPSTILKVGMSSSSGYFQMHLSSPDGLTWNAVQSSDSASSRYGGLYNFSSETAWDMDSIPKNSSDASSYLVPASSLSLDRASRVGSGTRFVNSGRNLIIWYSPGSLVTYSLSVPYNPNTASLIGKYNTLSFSSAEYIDFSDNGKSAVYYQRYPDRVTKYSLTNPFDFSTASIDGEVFNLPGSFDGDGARGMFVNRSGSKMLLFNTSGKFILYSLSK